MIYGYIRDSSEEGLSRAHQEKIILSSLDRFDGEFGGFFVDDEVFGRINIFERQAGEELFDRLTSGDYIIAYKLDRCFVSIENAVDTIEELQERNIYFNILETGVDMATASGEIMFDLVRTYATFNRKIKSRQMTDSMAKIKGQGRPVNKQSPIGYKVIRSDGQAAFIPDYKERELVCQIIEWKNTGTNWSEIVRRLSKKKRANGNKWNQTNVRVAYEAGLDGFPGAGVQKDAFAILEKDRKHSYQERVKRRKK